MGTSYKFTRWSRGVRASDTDVLTYLIRNPSGILGEVGRDALDAGARIHGVALFDRALTDQEMEAAFSRWLPR